VRRIEILRQVRDLLVMVFISLYVDEGFDPSVNITMPIVHSCCFYNIRDLHRIHRYISLSVPKHIATAFITSRLDYCNSLLYNIASKDILKLQCVQK